MAIEPKTIRETNIAVTGVDARLELVQKMVWAVIALLGALLAGAAALYFQIGDLKTDVAVIKSTTSATNERLARLEKSIDTVVTAGTTSSTALTRIEAQLALRVPPAPPPQTPRDNGTFQANLPPGPPPTSSVLALADEEAQFVREMLKPIRTGAAHEYQVGEIAPVSTLPNIPQSITAKISKLAGYGFTVDRGGAILIVDRATYHIAAIIPPA